MNSRAKGVVSSLATNTIEPAVEQYDKDRQGTFLSRQTEANVLLWCLRAVDYCKQTNRIHKLLRDDLSKIHHLDGLVEACQALELPGPLKDEKQLVPLLPVLIRQLERLTLPADNIQRSIDVLAERCSLTVAEKRLLLFAVMLDEHELLETVLNRSFSNPSVSEFFKIVSYLLKVPVAAVKDACRADRFLSRTRLIRLDLTRMRSFDDIITIRNGLVSSLETANGDWHEFMLQVCCPVRTSPLVADDFSHISSEWDLVLGYIRGTAGERRKGSNVLLHGPPGCGKSEFVRAVIAASGLPGFEVVSEMPDGRGLECQQRRSYFRLASGLLEFDQPSILVVDEMDGVLEIDRGPPEHSFGFSEQLTKASANALLESNPIPTIWITNHVHRLEEAQLRRYDLVLKFDKPPREIMKRQLVSSLGKHALPAGWVEMVSKASDLTPGVIRGLANVANALSSQDAANPRLQDLLNKALQQRGIQLPATTADQYRSEYCNASLPPKVISTMIAEKNDTRCILHGATGTGKTAFAKHIARSVGLEPRCVRPSDILDPYLGGTEKNIARLFDSALPAETMIIIDEFEGFAANRKGARYNWQISQVNELLVQLEAYRGRVITCTNLVDRVDPAIRRRFQLKVELFPLDLSQRENLIREYCDQLGLEVERDASLVRVARELQGLAYGHMVNAAEIARFTPDLTFGVFADLLRQEIEATNGPVARPIGFMQ